MHLLVNLTAILGLENVTNPLSHVSPRLWAPLNEEYPDHCYGDKYMFTFSMMDEPGVGYSDIPYHYRIDLRGILGWDGPREAVAVGKDQWLEIVKNPEWRKFCFGGETKGVLAKKQEKLEEQFIPTRPHGYDNWFSGVDYACKVKDDFGRRYVSRKVARDNWCEEGRSAKDFRSCETYAVAKGDVVISLEGGVALLFMTDLSHVG